MRAAHIIRLSPNAWNDANRPSARLANEALSRSLADYLVVVARSCIADGAGFALFLPEVGTVHQVVAGIAERLMALSTKRQQHEAVPGPH